MVDTRRIARILLTVLSAVALACSGDEATTTPPNTTPPDDRLTITLSPSDDSLLLGTSRQLVAQVKNQFGVARTATVHWETSNPSVISVGSTGLVSAFGRGSAQIIASIPGHADTSSLKVYGLSEPLIITPGAVDLAVGDDVNFSAALAGGIAGSGAAVEWQVSDPTVVTLDASGTASGLNEGTVTVTASLGDRLGKATVKVFRTPVASVTISPAVSTIASGATIGLDAIIRDEAGKVVAGRTCGWESSNRAVATIDNRGRVKGVAKGYSIITCSVEGKRGTATVNVLGEPVSGIAVTLPDSSLLAGQTVTASASLVDASGVSVTGSKIAWQSSNPAVVTVTSAGLVTAIASGSAKISAISGGQVGSAPVTVAAQAKTSLVIVPANPAVLVGQTAQLTGQVLDQNGQVIPGSIITWSSTTPAVATVNAQGLATGLAVGATQVRATSGTLSATTTLTVTLVSVASLRFVPGSVTLAPGQRRTLAVEVKNASGTLLTGRTVLLTSSVPSVAAVSPTGEVTAISEGSALIKATSEGKNAVAEVHVAAAVGAPVHSVTVTANSSNLLIEQSTQATAALSDSVGNVISGRPIVWTTTNAQLAKVSVSGQITAMGAGSVAIVATSEGVSGAITINVAPNASLPVASVSVAVQPVTVVSGASAQTAVTLRDSLGHVLTGRTIAYNSSNPTVASVSSSGNVSALSPGAASISAASGGKSGAASLSVTGGAPVVATVIVSAPSTALFVGDALSASASARDAGGNVISSSFTWSSSNPGVVSVDGTGIVQAVSAGSATILATSTNGVQGTLGFTSTVRPPTTIGSVTVTLGSGALTAGQTTQAAATVHDASNNVLPGYPVTWSSSNTAVATVTITGQVKGVGVGSASISATSGGKSGNALVTVTAATTPPPTGAIALGIVRFDGGTGNVLVSNGIPLPSGALQPSDVSKVRVFANGVEQSLYVEALEGRNSDGSLRTVLVQFNYNVPSSGSVTGTLHLGQARGTTDIVKPTNDRTTLTAAALPTDPTYLVSTEINGPTITSAEATSLGGSFARYESDFVKYANSHWTNDAAYWQNANYYDRALIYFAFWARSGNPEYFRRGALIAVNYREQYLAANNYGASPHWSQLEGLEQHYLLTGDDKSRTAVARTAEVMKAFHTSIADTINTVWVESRIQARVLQAYFLAWRINAVGPQKLNWTSLMDDGITKVLSTQRADGSFGFPNTCHMSLSYMNGLLNDQFIKMHTYYKADPRLVSSVQRSANYLSSKEWLTSANAFKYITATCINPSGVSVGGPIPAPDLNNLMVTAYGWLYLQTGQASYRSMGDLVFTGSVTQTWLPGMKQFNQQYTSSFRYLAYRK